MQLAIKKKKYFFEILKKKSLNPQLNNTSYDKGKKKIPSTKIFKKKFTRIRYQYFTTKKKKDFSIEIFKKKSRNLAFDINILQQRKKKDSFDRNIKKKASSLETRWYSTSISRNKFKTPWIDKKYDPRRHQPV